MGTVMTMVYCKSQNQDEKSFDPHVSHVIRDSSQIPGPTSPPLVVSSSRSNVAIGYYKLLGLLLKLADRTL